MPQTGAVYVMMFIWAGIYFGIGAVFEFIDLTAYTLDVIISATHKVATVAEFVADPYYDVTMAEMKERYGSAAGIEDEFIHISYFSRTLNVEGETSIRSVIYDINSFVNRHADTVWGSLCGIGCFIGLMNIFRARKANGDHGIAEFDI